MGFVSEWAFVAHVSLCSLNVWLLTSSFSLFACGCHQLRESLHLLLGVFVCACGGECVG